MQSKHTPVDKYVDHKALFTLKPLRWCIIATVAADFLAEKKRVKIKALKFIRSNEMRFL